MTQTIRDSFKRRKRRTLGAVGVGIAVMAVTGLVGGLTNVGSRYPQILLAVALVGLAIMFGGLLYLDRTRCPNCLGRSGPVLYTPGTNYCPQCGVSLDIPLYPRR